MNEIQHHSPRRQWWILPRTRACQRLMQDPLKYTAFQFHRSFRMRRSSFDQLLLSLSDTIRKKDTQLRQSVPPVTRLMIFLHHIAHGSRLSTLAELFGQGKTTCSEIITQVTNACIDVLLDTTIRWPSLSRMHAIMASFEKRFSVPQCVGLIDGTHIKIVRPHIDGEVYFNRKNHYSLNVEGRYNYSHHSH